MDAKELKKKCDVIRLESIRMTTKAASGHPSSCLSCAEIVGVLLLDIMDVDADNPDNPTRDRFILSKGHAAPAYYAALALHGFFPQEKLETLRELGSILQGHPDMKKTPGVDFSTGSLGMGLSVANGMALAGRLDNTGSNIYVVMGDGELQEGQVWEAAMTSSHYSLSNIVAIVDRNNLQCDGTTESIMALEPLDEKFRAFGWEVFEVDGHDVASLQNIIRKARDVDDRPSLIIAHTYKGKGVSCMQDKLKWHGKPLSGKEYEDAVKECSL